MESGASTASAVSAITVQRKTRVLMARPPLRSLPLHRRLPQLDELQPFLRVESAQELVTDRNRPRLVADELADALGGRLAVDVGAQGIKIGLVGDDVLSALGEEIIQKQLGGVGILRLLGNEGDARRDQRVVLRQDDADIGILLRARERIG